MNTPPPPIPRPCVPGSEHHFLWCRPRGCCASGNTPGLSLAPKVHGPMYMTFVCSRWGVFPCVSYTPVLINRCFLHVRRTALSATFCARRDGGAENVLLRVLGVGCHVFCGGMCIVTGWLRSRVTAGGCWPVCCHVVGGRRPPIAYVACVCVRPLMNAHSTCGYAGSSCLSLLARVGHRRLLKRRTAHAYGRRF